MYYRGVLRQSGGRGLGDAFHAFSRVLLPGMISMYRNRSNKNFWRDKAIQKGPSILKNAVKLGVGVVSDIARKKTLKQSLKERGQRLIADALNINTRPKKSHKAKRPRAGNRSRAAKSRTAKIPVKRKKIRSKKRPPDMFD